MAIVFRLSATTMEDEWALLLCPLAMVASTQALFQFTISSISLRKGTNGVLIAFLSFNVLYFMEHRHNKIQDSGRNGHLCWANYHNLREQDHLCLSAALSLQRTFSSLTKTKEKSYRKYNNNTQYNNQAKKCINYPQMRPSFFSFFF